MAICALALALAVGVPGPATAAPVARWTRCDVWTSVGTPDPTVLAEYRDVAVLDPWHAVAVGATLTGRDDRAIAAVWDGWRWNASPLEVPAARPWQLDGVAARSAAEVWAVGAQGSRPLIERYDGERWSIVPAPAPRGRSWLRSVGVVPGTESLWAVGARLWGGDAFPLILRWTGTRWVRSPTPGLRGIALEGVVAPGPKAWAVGSVRSPGGEDVAAPAMLRWNGETWSRRALPPGGAWLRSIDAGGPGDVLAVGTGTPPLRAYVVRWNGQRWARVTPARIPHLDRVLPMDVAYSSAGDAWIVGGLSTDPEAEWLTGVALQRVAGTWVRTTLRRPEGSTFPEGVDAATPHDVWVVGQEGGYETSPFAQHRC